MPTLEERVISGKGVVRMPLDSKDYTQAKIITVYATVVRKATSEYLNFAYNPPRSRYCTLSFMRAGHVIMSAAMEFNFQSWDFHAEIASQVMYAVQCSYTGILQTFVNLGNASGLLPYVVANEIADWVHTNLMFDEIKVVCYADTAVRISVRSTKYDLCPDQEDKQPDPPPPPPPNPPVAPPGTPLQDTDTPLSEPYDGEDDDGDTIPHPIDVPPPQPEFPIGNQCSVYTVAVSGQVVIGSVIQNNSIVVFGKVEYVGLNPNNPLQIIVIAYGDALAPGASCRSSPQTFVLLSSSSGYVPGSVSYTVSP